MKKMSILLAMTAVLTFATSALADSRPYVGFAAGVAIGEDSNIHDEITVFDAKVSLKTGYTFSGMVGVATDFGLRPEIELTYKGADFDHISAPGQVTAKFNGDARIFSTLANLYYDFKTGTLLTPYLGGGIGFARYSVSNTSISGFADRWSSGDDVVFAYQAGAGMKIGVTKNIALDLGYRYFGTEKADFGLLNLDYHSHNIQAGIQYQF